MKQQATWSRRGFLQSVAMAGAGCALLRRAGAAKEAAAIRWGVCYPFNGHAQLKAAGFDYIEEKVGSLFVPAKPDVEFAKIQEALKTVSLPVLTCNNFLPASMKIVGPLADQDTVARYAETALQRAGLIGLQIIVFGSGGARKIPDGFDPAKAREQFIAFVRRIAPAAEKAGVLLVLEPLNRKETNFINSITEGAAIVDEINHPAFRLHADLFHMMLENEDPAAITAAGGRIRHVHVSELDHARSAPLPGGADFKPYFKALKGIGYNQKISLECSWKKDANEFARSGAYIRGQWAAA
jgi:sugar phosphate isomerase/epimerase